MENRPSLVEVVKYECSLLCSAWRSFRRQQARHLYMEAAIVIAALLAPLALLVLGQGSLDRELYLDAAKQGVMTALIFAFLLFGWWLFTEGCRRDSSLREKAAGSEERARQAEACLDRRANALVLLPAVAPYPFMGSPRSVGEDFVIQLRRYESLVLEVTNESGAEISALLATITYYPAEGTESSVSGRWQETGMRSTALAFGETEALLVAYSSGNPPLIYSADAPADTAGVGSFVDPWSLGPSAYARLRLTADGIDRRIDLSLTFEHNPISDEVEARIALAPSGAIESWSPSPPPMTAYDTHFSITHESSWSKLGESFESLQLAAEDVCLHINAEGDVCTGELSGRVPKGVLKRAKAVSAIAGRKLHNDSVGEEGDAQRWFLAVANAAGGGSNATRVVYFVSAAKSLCLYRAAQEDEESDQ